MVNGEWTLEARVGAGFDAFGFGQMYGFEHYGGVAGVEAAGDVGDVDVVH